MQDIANRPIPPSTPAQLSRVAAYTEWALGQPQVDIPTTHLIHAGMYHRTCCVPKGHAVSGAVVKIPTVLTFHGVARVYLDGEFVLLSGYQVLPASAGRAQVLIALEDTHVTMSFPTEHTSVSECEKQFTDSWALLGTNRKDISCQDG